MTKDTNKRTTGSRGGAGVFVALSTAQVEQVVLAASDGGSMSVLLSGLGDGRTALAARRQRLESSRLSRSLLLGLLILASFPADGSYLSVTDVARTCATSPSTAHRYISTLIAVGLLERDSGTREYRLAR